MRVETRRMIPVIHARLNLTRYIAAIEAVALVLDASASRLEICNEDSASMMDAKDVEASLADITSPTIFPILTHHKYRNRKKKSTVNSALQI